MRKVLLFHRSVWFSNVFAAKAHLVFMLCALCVLCGEITAQDFKTVHDGVEYAKVSKEISGLNVNINLLRLDLKKVRLDVHHAMDAAIGTEKTSSIAMRHGAVAAINAGFFRLDRSSFAGETVGTLAVDGVLQSENVNGRSTLVIDSGKKVTSIAIFHLETTITISTNDDNLPNSARINGINREMKEGEIVLYTKFFGKPVSTDLPGVLAFSLARCRVDRMKGMFKLPYVKCLEFAEVKQSEEYLVPVGGYLLLVSSPVVPQVSSILRRTFTPSGSNQKRRFGLKFTYRDRGAELLLDKSTDLIAGIPQLIKNGKIDITWEQEKTSKSFVETRHPRTAVAKLKDGKFLMITVDGRSESSGGISLQDLAEYLLSLGAVDAMNLDGGGSTTMFLDGKVVNTPSDKEGERKIGDAILVTLRKNTRAKK